MNAATISALDALASAGGADEGPREWVRVQVDTGGIAAGAGEVLERLRGAMASLRPELLVQQVGSSGFAFADPVVEVQVAGMPRVMYGRVEPEQAVALLEAHLTARRLADDHVIATRRRGAAIDSPVTHVLVKDTGSGHLKTEFVQFSLAEELKRRGIADRVQVVRALDVGIYDEGVAVQLLPGAVTYTNVLAPDVARIVEASIIGGAVLDDLLWRKPDPQVRIVLRNCGNIDPDSIDDYIAHGRGYHALRKVLGSMQPEDVIAELKTSGLRGRGGAGFPTWLKWDLTRKQPADQRYVICNADEGDPGAFMDRSVLESDPHSVLEGMIIAAYAMGCSMGYFYVRAEYPKAVERVERAIAQARAAGLLGRDVLGSGFAFEAKIRLGAGAFVCGEETALIASIEGRRGSPTPRPPYPSVRGLWGKPTAINNVETLANIPAILLEGGAWYASHGTETSKGTKVFAVTGKVAHAQLVEVPMGTTLAEIVHDVCGGLPEGRDVKAVQTGGPSGGVIPDKHLDTPVSYETLQKLGSIMGSGGLIVMDADDSMVDVARFYLRFCVDESCGKCAPCRIGGYQMLQILDRLARGRGSRDDIAALRRICLAMQKASLCGLGQTAPNPVLSTLRYFENEYTAYIEGGPAYARKMSRAASPASSSTTTATLVSEQP
ncbi:NADH-quinone oxidoreductase subunit NuoF [Opitutales bacterium ASA1]|uniref:NADH-ubiquinone oxidoreductase-F iron-sulfur binding region domain-containing protein n=1 Tax=Congregicoccus parvus TaxID=3081749 RepID=UPI002B27F80F|nr:NADH-quinone oxidoreductase subunit NuoF [Opitutales bacterium ASA1]